MRSMKTLCRSLLLSALCCAALSSPSDAQTGSDSATRQSEPEGLTRELTNREKNGLMMVMFLMGVSGFGAFIAYASWASFPPKPKDETEQGKEPSA